MKKRTRWKRVYNPIIGVRFFEGGDLAIGFFTIEKLWIAKEYCAAAQRHDGKQWTNWFDKTMMKIRTDEGFVYKMPFCPWMKAYDKNQKSMSDYYNENSMMTRKPR